MDQYDYVDKRFIHAFGDIKQIEEILRNLEKIQKEYKEECVLLIDDPIGCLDFKAPWFKHLISTYRQFKINIVIATQSKLNVAF